MFGCDGTFSTVRDNMWKSGGFNYTCSQECIEHGYKELHMPPTAQGEYAMAPNRLHIWPRQKFAMIALPNPDESFTLALFMPFKMFDDIKTKKELLLFFEKHFPDSTEKIGEDKLVNDFKKNPTGSLYSIKCSPYYNCSIVLLGDAAHAVVPFFGQGTNAGISSMEDCLVFDESLEKVMTSGGVSDLEAAAKAYSEARWRDGHAIADLSMSNYDELRSLDTDKHQYDPSRYTNVAFTRTSYHDIWEGKKSEA